MRRTFGGGIADLDWQGRRLNRQVIEAARKGINDTLAESVFTAKARTPVVSGRLQRAITRTPATVDRRRQTIEGSFGIEDRIKYGLEVEEKRRMLRMSAEEHFPTLAKQIRRRLRRAGVR